jgi:transcriptional regulator with XRE-family HTH domain
VFKLSVTFSDRNSPMANMTIARFARKERLPHGAQSRIAEKLGVADSVVSRVMNDKAADLNPKTVRRIRVAIARKLRMRVDEVFPDQTAAA